MVFHYCGEFSINMESILILNEELVRYMVKLNRSDLLKIKILKQLKKKNIEYTASYLSAILNAKFETVKNALEFFYEIDLIDKDVKEHGVKNITYYFLSSKGKKLIESNKI